MQPPLYRPPDTPPYPAAFLYELTFRINLNILVAAVFRNKRSYHGTDF